MRKIARETGISPESVRQISKYELQLKPYNLHRVQLLTGDNKRVLLERCRRLLRRVTPQNCMGTILFTDEKLFAIEQVHNHQNARNCMVRRGPRDTSAIVAHRQNPNSVMVCAGICAQQDPFGFRR